MKQSNDVLAEVEAADEWLEAAGAGRVEDILCAVGDGESALSVRVLAAVLYGYDIRAVGE
jgi:hypothetical protein